MGNKSQSDSIPLLPICLSVDAQDGNSRKRSGFLREGNMKAQCETIRQHLPQWRTPAVAYYLILLPRFQATAFPETSCSHPYFITLQQCLLIWREKSASMKHLSISPTFALWNKKELCFPLHLLNLLLVKYLTLSLHLLSLWWKVNDFFKYSLCHILTRLFSTLIISPYNIPSQSTTL